jgi:hypothetical protein
MNSSQMSDEEHSSFSREVLDYHESGIQPLESRVSPSDCRGIPLGELIGPYHYLRLMDFLVETLERLCIERLEKNRIHDYIAFRDIERHRFEAFPPDSGHYSACFTANILDARIPTS